MHVHRYTTSVSNYKRCHELHLFAATLSHGMMVAVQLTDVSHMSDRCLTDQRMTCTVTPSAWTDIRVLALPVLDMHKQDPCA